MRKKAIVFPYDFSLRHIKRFEAMVAQYEIIQYITHRNVEEISHCDTLLIMDTSIPIREGFIYRWIVDHVDKFTEILDLREKLNSSEMEEMKKFCQHGIKYMKPISYRHTWKEDQRLTMEEIEVPIILVQGAGDHCDKYHVEMCLRDRFTNDGYKVGQIGSKSYSHLFGVHPFPHFMMESKLSLEECVLRFNQLIKDMENQEQPDIIIIGIPGGIIPINEVFHGDFGIRNYIISQAVVPDVVVFSTWFDDYNSEYIEEMSNLFKYKFGYSYDFMHVSDVQFDYIASREYRTPQYLTYDSIHVDKKIKEMQELECKAYNMLDDEAFNKVYSEIKQLLTGTDTLKYCI